MSSQFTQTRFGNSITFPGGIVNGQPPRNERVLLEVNLAELAASLSPQELGASGPWVFMVETIITAADWPVVPGPGSYQVIPLKLRFTIGSGGAVHQLEIDAHPHAALQIPSATCRVEVFWDRLPNIAAGDLWIWQIPNQVRIHGTIQRANVVPNAHRSFLCNQDAVNAAPALIVTTNADLPRFARDVMVYHYSHGNAAYLPTANLSFWTGLPGESLVHVTGNQLLAIMLAGNRYPIPAHVNWWQFQYMSPTFHEITIVDFSVTF